MGGAEAPHTSNLTTECRSLKGRGAAGAGRSSRARSARQPRAVHARKRRCQTSFVQPTQKTGAWENGGGGPLPCSPGLSHSFL